MVDILARTDYNNTLFGHILDQWFPTGVPRHTWVPWTGDRGAAN